MPVDFFWPFSWAAICMVLTRSLEKNAASEMLQVLFLHAEDGQLHFYTAVVKVPDPPVLHGGRERKDSKMKGPAYGSLLLLQWSFCMHGGLGAEHATSKAFVLPFFLWLGHPGLNFGVWGIPRE